MVPDVDFNPVLKNEVRDFLMYISLGLHMCSVHRKGLIIGFVKEDFKGHVWLGLDGVPEESLSSRDLCIIGVVLGVDHKNQRRDLAQNLVPQQGVLDLSGSRQVNDSKARKEL